MTLLRGINLRSRRKRASKMAAARCKIIIDGGRTALANALERVLIDELALRRGLLSDDTPLDGVTRGAVLKMIQTLADIDISAMHGTPMPTGGLLGVVCVLESWGWFDADVWKVLPKP